MFYQNAREIKSILIVDDEQPIVDILAFNLKNEGYKIFEANDGEKAVEIVKNEDIDMVLLDVMIPKMDGLLVCKEIKKDFNIPILMISAKGDESDKIEGLDIGADDYITKPFSVKELIARVKANLRKIQNEISEQKKENPIVKIGNVIMDKDKVEVKVKGIDVNLTLLEYKVFEYIASQQGNPVDRKTLIKDVWCYGDYYGDTRIVDVTISRIREKIEEIDPNSQILLTKRGLGYCVAYDM